MKTMLAKYPGVCRSCGESIRPGDTINFYGRGHAEHSTCSNAESSAARSGVSVARFSSGAVVYRNARGRCEDAPCCGCCS